jgi:hypothetical protein
MRRPFPKLSRGAIALVALSFVSVLGLVLAGYFAISQQSMRLSNRSYGATVSEQLAELGLEEALRAVTTNNFADWTSGTAPDQTTVDWTLTAATADTAATATAIITPPATRYGNAGVAGTAKIRIDNYDAYNRDAIWVDGTAYRIGDLIGRSGLWYRCVQNHTASSSTNRPPNFSFWVPEPIPSLWSNDIAYAQFDLANHLGIWYRCITAIAGSPPYTAPAASASWVTIPASRAWTASTAYALHDVVRNTNAAGDIVLYRCTIAHTSSADPDDFFTTDAANWTTAINAVSRVWTPGEAYPRGAVVFNPGTTGYTGWYLCVHGHTAGAFFPTDLDVSPPLWSLLSTASAPAADNWRSTTQYIPGDYVYVGGAWYRCSDFNLNSIPPNPAFWQTSSQLPYISWAWRSTFDYSYNSVVLHSTSGPGTWYRNVAAGSSEPPSASWQNAITGNSGWSATSNYNIGDAAFRGGLWYRCTVAHINQDPPNTAYWSTAPRLLNAWDSGRQYAVDDMVTYGGTWYRCLVAHNGSNPSVNATSEVPSGATWASANTASSNWNSTTPYTTASRVTYGGVWYRCILAHTNFAPGNATYWTAMSSASTWSSTTAYTTASRVTYGNVWYRCILAHTNIAPGNATYWTAMGAPVIYAEGTANLIRESVPLTTQLRATVAPAPLVPNAVAGTTTLTITGSGAGTVDSYDAQPLRGTYASQTPGFAAVLAAGQTTGNAATITNTRVQGYVAAPSASAAPHAPLVSFGGSAVVTATTDGTTVEQARVSRSPYIPQFNLLPANLQTAMSATNFPMGTNIQAVDLTTTLSIGTPGGTTPSRYFFNGSLDLGSAFACSTLNILGPVILYVNGSLRIQAGGIIDLKATASLELHCDHLRTDAGGHGFFNRSLDPTKLTVIVDNGRASNLTAATYLNNGDSGINPDFYGVIYMPNTTATLGLEVRTGVKLFGAISARKVTFPAEANVHYDTTLRSTAIPGVERAFLLSDWRELINPAERVTLP